MSDGTSNQELVANGWTAVPRSFEKNLAHVDKKVQAKASVGEIQLPDSDLVKKTYEYAKKERPEKTFNHSMRVYYYGMRTFLPLSCQVQRHKDACLKPPLQSAHNDHTEN